MASRNVERFHAGFEAFARGDLESAFAFISPDFELVDHVMLENVSGKRGPEAFVVNREQLLEAFADVVYEILEIEQRDDLMLVRVRATARGAHHTGIDTVLEVGQVWTLEGDIAVRMEIFPSWEVARRAAGLEPER